MEKFSLYFPLKPQIVTQIFGVNGKYYQDHGVDIVGHNGIDFLAYHGQPIYAAHDGIAYYEVDEDQGDGFVVISNKPFDYNGVATWFKTVYWHLISARDATFHPVIATDRAVPVVAGQLLGFADSTGLSTGDHLHFALKPVAPGEAPQMWYNVAQKNGYQGAIDPQPFFNGKFAEDLPAAKYRFVNPIEFGDLSVDALMLQDKLKRLGFFPWNRNPTGYYGKITQDAVLAFQTKFNVDTLKMLMLLNGTYVGPKTRAALNVR